MYAKLFSRIAQSSLMEETVTTRYTFMMMLSLADQRGDIIGTDLAISRMLNITLEEFKLSIIPLLSPDPDSNSQVEQGRRLIPSANGRGYMIVNYARYRDIKSNNEKREYMRNYMRERRAVNLTVKHVSSCKDELSDVTHTEAEAEAEADTVREAKASPVVTQPIGWNPTDGWSGITDGDHADWKIAYPACDIPRQFAVMTQWLKSNPAKAKKKAWRKFITGWLGKEQDRGGDLRHKDSNRSFSEHSSAKQTATIGQLMGRRTLSITDMSQTSKIEQPES